ncbi:MAG: phosphoribosylformylglycinamidine synthase subunit PurL [Coriobacteriia bacterium]|nr:phosphoribosylformylglycinamidine synthase subunit PurL [Coriobacteriia bacterium]MCL2871191.1 phosphoribosylformylglycinamidine synthase subunit PurL [Coriobacteriia bacterium]
MTAPTPDLSKTDAPQLAEELGLRPGEYTHICELLGRIPTICELYMYSLMWSEHCSYKHSKVHLRKFPTEGEYVLQGPGENAGVISVGDGWALAFKMESHNHPSAIEPYHGAATGIGGCMRDIFTMGARPIAALNSLRFGSLDQPRQRFLATEAARGFADFAKGIGVPTLGGEIHFDDAYKTNCLVNAMGIGLMREEHLTRAQASGTGNLLVLLGAKTGRDGIGGASILASAEFSEEGDQSADASGAHGASSASSTVDLTQSEVDAPTMVTGDPELGRRLAEACLELLESGLLVGLGDLGAAGLTSSGSEMASRAGMGITIDVTKVPTLESGMRPFETMVSESQERMLAVCAPDRLDEVFAVCKKWDVLSTVIGEVTDSGNFTVVASIPGTDEKTVYANIPARSLADDAPEYDPPYTEPTYIAELRGTDLSGLNHPQTQDELNASLLKVLASSNIASRGWIGKQCELDDDEPAKDSVVIAPGADAGLFRIGIPGKPETMTNRGIAASCDCNGRYVYLNPRRGAQIAVAEAARNVSCVGATPAALTDCLNFGSPEKPEIYWTFVNSIEGISESCEVLNVPVVSGNVSLYNESDGNPIYPTPAIGLVGIIDDLDKHCTSDFKTAGDTIILIGETLDEIGGSEYLKTQFDLVAGDIPSLDLDLEACTQKTLRELIDAGLIKSAHDCSDGGLAVALVESAVQGGLGFEVALDDTLSAASSLFSESQSRVVVSSATDKVDAVLDALQAADVSFSILGDVGGDRVIIKDKIDLPLAKVSQIWSDSLEQALFAEGSEVGDGADGSAGDSIRDNASALKGA